MFFLRLRVETWMFYVPGSIRWRNSSTVRLCVCYNASYVRRSTEVMSVSVCLFDCCVIREVTNGFIRCVGVGRGTTTEWIYFGGSWNYNPDPGIL